MTQQIQLGEYRASVVTELDELAALAPAWDSCKSAFGGSYVEQHLDFYQVGLGAWAEAGTPLVVMLHHRDQLVGIAPFVVKCTRWTCTLGYGSLVSFPIRQAHAYGEALLLPPEAGVYHALLLALARCEHPCHALFFESVPTASVLWQTLQASAKLPIDHWRYSPGGEVPHRKVRLDRTFDDYRKNLNSRHRWKVQRAVDGFERAFPGRWSVHRVTAPEQVRGYAEAVEAISGLSWQGRQLRHHLRATPDRLQYLEACAQRGWLRSYILQCDGRPIAFVEGLQPESVFTGDFTGYLPDWQDRQPGKVLFYKIIEDLHDWKPPRTLDFGYGDSDYKRHFSNDTTGQVNVYLFRKSLYTGTILATHSVFVGIKRTGQRFLDRIGKREAVRRVLRRR